MEYIAFNYVPRGDMELLDKIFLYFGSFMLYSSPSETNRILDIIYNI